MTEDPLKIEFLDNPHNEERPIQPTRGVLGSEDRETEAKFGRIVMSPEAVSNVSRLSLMNLEDEVGGFLVGWDEGGTRIVVDILVHIPENPQVGQFSIMDGEVDMLRALELMRENPAYNGHNLEVLGWWHTHPPEMRAVDGTTIPAWTPVPTGGMREGRMATGDMGVTEFYSRKFGKPQDMLIVQTTSRDKPVEVALWRWDDTEGAEQAYYQRGLRLGSDRTVENTRYWELPEGGMKAYPLRIKEEDVIRVEVEEAPLEINLDEVQPLVITESDIRPDEQDLEITILDEQTREPVAIDVKDLYGRNRWGQIKYGLDQVKQSPNKLRALKEQATAIIKSPWGKIPEVRITAEDILRETENRQ